MKFNFDVNNRKLLVEHYMKAYDPDTDYKPVHLEWLGRKENKYFQEFSGKSDVFETEYDYYYYLYMKCDNRHNITNQWVYLRYCDHLTFNDRKNYRKDQEKELVSRMFSVPTESNYWFVTIGFQRENYRDVTAIECINKFLTYDWVLSCQLVMEFFTENGWRPHIMMKLEVPVEYKSQNNKIQKMTKYYVIHYIYKSSGFTRTGLLGGKEHIDCDVWQDRHNAYIELDKSEDKIEYLRQDQEYREKNGIPHKFEK